MNKLMLFVDGSVDPQTKVGYGTYLAVSENTLFADTLKRNVKTKRFNNTSSTKLELETLLWALKDLDALTNEHKIIIYTDSQNIMSLETRRTRLEQDNYYTKCGRLINNHELYKKFYRIVNNLNIPYF